MVGGWSTVKVTPDPGVIEVNMHPALSWRELADNTAVLYEEARLTRLGTEKFMLDGRHTGTGGGNESTILTFIPTLLHHGMVYVGLPYACPELADISEVKGGSPYGAGTIAGPDERTRYHRACHGLSGLGSR